MSYLGASAGNFCVVKIWSLDVHSNTVDSGSLIELNMSLLYSSYENPGSNTIGLDGDLWIDELKGFKSIGYTAVGTIEQLKSYE